MIRVQTRDIVTLGKSKKTREGFIVADATFSRTGCQDYSRRELGLDGDPNEIVTLYRPPEEVFAPESLASLDGKPLTLRHPPEDVTTDTWAKYAVGEAAGVKKGADGQTTTGKATLRRRDAVDAYEAGTRELSVGYAFDLDMTPGTAPDGKSYQGVQRNIRGNHHAIVDEGRCGGECRVGDQARKATDCNCNKHTGDAMPTMRKITTADSKFLFVDAKGKEVTIPALDIDLDVSTPEGAKAADAIDRFTRGMKDCMAAHDSVKAEVGVHKERADAAEKRLNELDAMPDDDDEDEDEEEEKGDKKGKDAKRKLGDRVVAYVGRLLIRAKAGQDEKLIEGRVAERQTAIAGAAKILGSDFKPEGKSTKEIQVAALTSVLSKDGALKAIATAALGGVEPAKVAGDKLATAFSTVIAASAGATGHDTKRLTDSELEVGRALAGSGGGQGGGDKPALIGRDAMVSKMFGGADAAS